jgi:dTDP-glucose 4,6-dehydratase
MSGALLVTGGAGFIGANFVHHRRATVPDQPLVVLDKLTYAGVRASIAEAEAAGGVTFVEGDIGDQALVEHLLRAHQVRAIVHFAAESHVDRSIVGPDVFLETNVLGTHALLKAARACWPAGDPAYRFHHVSTDEVYGTLGPDDAPFHEGTPYAPNSPYSASKAASDHLVRAYHHTYGLPVTTSNCSNNFGPYQFPEKLVPLMITRALDGGELPVYGDGTNRRDWLHVGDHCAGVSLTLAAGRVGETYVFGGHGEMANLALVELIADTVDAVLARDPVARERFPHAAAARGGRSREQLRFVTDRPGHDWRYAVDCRKAARELGWRPAATVAEAIRQTVTWYIAHEAWWRPLVRTPVVRH